MLFYSYKKYTISSQSSWNLIQENLRSSSTMSSFHAPSPIILTLPPFLLSTLPKLNYMLTTEKYARHSWSDIVFSKKIGFIVWLLNQGSKERRAPCHRRVLLMPTMLSFISLFSVQKHFRSMTITKDCTLKELFHEDSWTLLIKVSGKLWSLPLSAKEIDRFILH